MYSIGAKPELIVFNIASGRIVRKLDAFLERRILAVAFDPTGAYVVAVGSDAKHTCVIHMLSSCAFHGNSFEPSSTLRWWRVFQHCGVPC